MKDIVSRVTNPGILVGFRCFKKEITKLGSESGFSEGSVEEQDLIRTLSILEVSICQKHRLKIILLQGRDFPSFKVRILILICVLPKITSKYS